MRIEDVPIRRTCPTDAPLALLERQRAHCDHCGKDIHNLSAMTEPAARALIAAKTKPICIFYQASDDGELVFAPATLLPTSRLVHASATVALAAAICSSMACASAPAKTDLPTTATATSAPPAATTIAVATSPAPTHVRELATAAPPTSVPPATSCVRQSASANAGTSSIAAAPVPTPPRRQYGGDF